MSCSYKETKSGCAKPWCKFTSGECQFIVGDYDMRLCPLHSKKEESIVIDVDPAPDITSDLDYQDLEDLLD